MAREDTNHATAERPVPTDLTAEAHLLGAVLLTPAAFADVSGLVTTGDFYKPQHGHIWAALVAVDARGGTIDVTTVAHELTRRNLLDQAGGTEALVELSIATPAATNAASYARIVADASRRRRLMGAASELIERAREWGEVDDLLDGLVGTSAIAEHDNLGMVDTEGILSGAIETPAPYWLKLTDGTALLYPAQLHAFNAEPGVGKSWLALAAIAEVLEAGGNAAYLDYEDIAQTILGRLLALGVSRSNLTADRFRYFNPGGLELADRRDLIRLISTELDPCELVVFDGVAEALVRDGLSEKDNTDVTAWTDRLPRAVARQTGAAVILLDHVTKAQPGQDRARGGRGAGAKLAGVEVSYSLAVARAFDRQTSGAVTIKVEKDRNGTRRWGTTCALARIRPGDDGATVAITFEPPPDPAEWKPTGIMAQMSRAMEQQAKPATEKHWFSYCGGTVAHRRAALSALVEGGYVKKTAGPGGSELFSHLKAYRDPDDDAGDPGPTEPPPDNVIPFGGHDVEDF